MDLKVPYSKIAQKKEAFQAAKAHIPEVLEKFKVSADVKFDETNHKMTAKGSGFEMKIDFHDAEAVVSLDLSFLLKPLKGKILESVEKQIKKVV